MSNQANKRQIQFVSYAGVRRPFSKRIMQNGDLGEEVFDYFYEPRETAKIVFNGADVAVILEDGSKGVATCHPSDTFDPKIGVKIAFARAKLAQAIKLSEPPEYPDSLDFGFVIHI